MWTLLGAALSGCVVAPPIVGTPDETDTPPYFLPEDVAPSEGRVTIDLSDPSNVAFSVQRFFDWNAEDELTYEWRIESDQSQIPQVLTGALRPTSVDPDAFGEVTVYEGVQLVITPCSALFDDRAKGSNTTVTLTVSDPISASPGALPTESFELVIRWPVQFTNNCPQ